MVLTSVYLSVSESLPGTQAIKPVEEWLLFNLFYPFLVIVVNIMLQVKSIHYYNWIILFEQASEKNIQNKNQDMTKWATATGGTTIKKVTNLEQQSKATKSLKFCAKYLNPSIYLFFSVWYLVYYLLIF